ncbi:MAG TPA: HAMP domain-containing histidine kinase [bacterium]|nr:HAMP domain-containing histidine kinase [bacterium]
MARTSPRFSSRHLLALGTFLVPLAVLAVLGWNELRRSGARIEASLEREARQFLASARQAIDRQIELQVPAAMFEAERLLIDNTPTQTAIELREKDGGIPAVLDVLLLNELAGLAWPELPTFTATLPLLREPEAGQKEGRLATAETLLAHGEFAAAIAHLEDLIRDLQGANPPDDSGRRARSDLLETEAHARFHLGAAHRKLGHAEAAREQFREVAGMKMSHWRFARSSAALAAIRLVALGALAEMASDRERLDLLEDIAFDVHDAVADGLSSAVAARLAATFPDDHAQRDRVDLFLRQCEQRAATRHFAGNYELGQRGVLRGRLQRLTQSGKPWTEFDERIVSMVDDYPTLLVVHHANPELQRTYRDCQFLAINFDLDALLGPAFEAFLAADGNYRLAVSDPDDIELVAPPGDVPEGFTPPQTETNGLVLRAYPANPAQLLAEARADANKRTILVLALFGAALGGALWSWRSASREAELAALKLDLVSRVSHELKTPLALIRMYGETIGMGRTKDPDQASEFGSIIARESDRLTTLIQRILDFSRQQAGTLTYQSERHDLGELLRETAYAYAPHLEEKGAILIDSLPLGIEVDCDRDGLEGAIVNLLENAAKYGRPADPDGDGAEHEIELHLQRVADHAIIEVLDRGRGIPPRERKRIFEGFYRASNSGEVRGAGLGLGIVQHFARAHGGDIEALPRDGGGTIMRLTLPLSAAGGAAAGPSPSAPARGKTHP